MTRRLIFALIILLQLYVWFSLLAPLTSVALQLAGTVVGLAFFGAVLWIVLVFWNRESDETSASDRAIQWVAYVGMGIVSFLLVLTAARDLASVFFKDGLRTEASSLLIFALAAALVAAGFLRAHFGVREKRVRIQVEGLPRELEGFKIAQLTDVHVGPTIRRGFLNRLVAIVNASEADVLVVTGDVADGIPADLAAELEPFRAMSAKLAKLYVTGNHEYYWAGAAWIEKMRELGFEPLLNRSEVVERGGRKLAFAGIPDPAATTTGAEGPDLPRAMTGIPGDASVRVLLCHQPQFAAQAAKFGFDLQLSGHTHAGQFFPWTFFASRVHRELNQGLTRVGKTQVYVSRGTGYWGPPVRLGAPPEVTVLELSGSAGT